MSLEKMMYDQHHIEERIRELAARLKEDLSPAERLRVALELAREAKNLPARLVEAPAVNWEISERPADYDDYCER